jgi:hypothetical protein
MRSKFHGCEIEDTIGSSPEGGLMAILLSQTAHATVKRMQSRLSGMTQVSAVLRQHVGSESVESGALSGPGRGRALVRNRVGEDLTFNSRSTRRRPPQCGWKKELGRGPVVARMPQSSFRKGGSDRYAEHRPPRPHGPRDRAIHQNLAYIRVPLGVQGRELVPVTSPAGRVEEGARRTDF